MSYQLLTQKHPSLTYQSYSHSIENKQLFINYHYQLANGPLFQHQLIFPLPHPQPFINQSPTLINNLIFNLGLIELFSYWKLACSPEIIINCGSLNQDQLNYWHHLLLNGMGEFFYLNQIDFTSPNFVTFITNNQQTNTAIPAHKNHSHRLSALNLGGGKDSAVMLDFFSSSPETFINLILTPASPAASKMAQLHSVPTYQIQRQFDSQLIDLNQKNYLNGHVPFSASLAFINLLASIIYDFDYAVVGNEHSANEQTLNWLSQPINHQYSKSTNFEQRFREYSKKYLIDNVEYFSLIRPFSELKVAQIFSTLTPYFEIFKSCNRGQKTNSWCHQCPKCLFVLLILFPFIDEQILTTKIFNHHLFNDLSLLPILQKLIGQTDAKPFECIGTIIESQTAFHLSLQKYLNNNRALPPLLAAVKTRNLPPSPTLNSYAQTLLNSFYHPHFLPSWALSMLQSTYAKN